MIGHYQHGHVVSFARLVSLTRTHARTHTHDVYRLMNNNQRHEYDNFFHFWFWLPPIPCVQSSPFASFGIDLLKQMQLIRAQLTHAIFGRSGNGDRLFYNLPI